MSKGGNLIGITVSRSGSSWTFSGADDAKGNVVVTGKGAVRIEFKRAAGQTWEFMDPYIKFGQYGSPKNQAMIPGVLVLVPGSTGADQVAIVDTNSQSPKTAGFYEYSLYVNDGGLAVTIDPMIVNNGGP